MTDPEVARHALDLTWSRIWELPSERTGHRLFPGAVLLWGVDSETVGLRYGGWARRFGDQQARILPAREQLPVRPETVFDLASISKVFTTLVIMQLIETGQVELDRPVIGYLPEFGAGGKASITVEQLLTHTSGFPAEVPLWRWYPDPAGRSAAALTADPVASPGSTYCYSDLNLITLGELAHRITGQPLDVLVADRITGPLGMIDTGFRPDRRDRIAATEEQQQPARGLVWGEVHDENAWSLDGVAGHAGVFGTAADLAVLARTMIDHGAYSGGRILGEDTFAAMISNRTPGFAGHDHGLGFEIGQPWYMGRMAGPAVIGHTGYTGTSLVIDLDRGAYVILLTNRVHPSRTAGKINTARTIAADGLADLLDRLP